MFIGSIGKGLAGLVGVVLVGIGVELIGVTGGGSIRSVGVVLVGITGGGIIRSVGIVLVEIGVVFASIYYSAPVGSGSTRRR